MSFIYQSNGPRLHIGVHKYYYTLLSSSSSNKLKLNRTNNLNGFSYGFAT